MELVNRNGAELLLFGNDGFTFVPNKLLVTDALTAFEALIPALAALGAFETVGAGALVIKGVIGPLLPAPLESAPGDVAAPTWFETTTVGFPAVWVFWPFCKVWAVWSLSLSPTPWPRRRKRSIT